MTRGGVLARQPVTAPPKRTVKSLPTKTPAGQQNADPEWTPRVFHGSPQEMVSLLVNAISTKYPDAGAEEWRFVVSTGSHLILFVGKKRKGTFQLDPKARQLPAGVFRSHDRHPEQLWVHRGDERTEWVPLRSEDEKKTVDFVIPAQIDEYLKLRGPSEGVVFLRAASTGGEAGAGGEGGGEKTTAEGEGGGEGGEAAPVIPDWAQLQFKVVRDRVSYERRHIRDMAGKGVGEQDPAAIERLLALAAVPSNVKLGTDGKDPVLMVEVPKNRGAIALTQGQGPGLLWERVQAVTRALNAGQKPARDAKPQDIVVGLPSEETPDPDKVAPNKEAYPAEIVNLGPATGIAYSVHRFQMNIDWTVEGQYATFAAFGPRAYNWDIFRLRTAIGALSKADEKSRKVGRGQAAGAELKGGFGEIGEDVEASVREEIIDPTTGTAIAVDAAVRSIGTLVRSFVSLASTPTNERGVKWEEPGTYVVRCLSARPPLSKEDAPENPVVRAPSVAFYPIRVMSAKDLATQLTAPAEVKSAEAKLAELTQKLAKATGDDRAAIEEEIAEQRAEIERLRAADETETGAHLDALDAQTDEQIAMTQMVADLRNITDDALKWKDLIPANTPALLKPPKMTADLLFGQVVGLHVQLSLSGRQPATVLEELRRVREQTRKQRGAVLEVAGEMTGPRFRPHMSFVPRSGGAALPLLMVLGEAAGDSAEGHRKWLLFDLSTPGHHDKYTGTSSALGAAGHAEAIRGAIMDFVRDVPYGRGTVGVRLPESLTKRVKPESINVAPTITATPGPSKRWESRLESIASAAATAALLVTGPVGIALGVVGGVAGGIVAAYRIHRRYEGGYLEMDLATAMDITAIVGAAVAPLGAWAGSVRAGAAAAGTATKWVAIAGRVERAVRVFGYLQLGSQIFVIPITLAQELAAIDQDKSLSPGERAARRAMAFLNATRAGLESLGTAHQMLADHVQVTDAPTPELPTAKPTETTTTRPAETTTQPREVETTRPAETAPRPEEITPPKEAPAPTTETPRPTETTTRPEPKPGEETVEPGGRTAAGTGEREPPQRTGSGVDANPAGRARAVELIEQRLRSGKRRQPEKSSQKVTQKDFDARPASADEALAIYDRVVAQSGGNEVGLFYNPNTGEFAVRAGTEFSVSPPEGEGWQAIVHLHPTPENVVIRRMPAPADVMGAVRAAMRTGSHTEFVQFVRPDGTVGYSRVEVTINPPRIKVELPGEPATHGHAGESPRMIDVTTPEAYAREYGSETSHLDPNSGLYRWIIRDLDAFYAALRSGRGHGAGEGRTAAGTVLSEPEAPGATRPGARQPGPVAPTETAPPPGFREELSGRRPDVEARFAEADEKFKNLKRKPEGAVAPSVAFDTAMATLERRGMGPEGRAAVERLLQPGRGQKELSASRLKRVSEAMQFVAELVEQRPDLLEPEGQVHYRTQIRELADMIKTAYQQGRTLEGTRLSRPDSPELADAMRRMNQAIDEQSRSPIRDPVAKLLELLTLRDQVSQVAGEILRSYGPKFTATPETVGPRRRARDSLVRGVPERPISVEASGVVGEPIARDLPGLGLEEYMLAPRKLEKLPTRTEGLGEQLAQLLRGWHRAHLIGPGFGTELFTGLMLAPEDVNLRVQNDGVEHFIRTAAAHEDVAEVNVSARAEGRRLEVPLKKGTADVDVLSRVEYKITVELKAAVEGQGASRTYDVVIEIGPPPEGTIRVDSTIPADAPGGDVLATFPRITPVTAPP
ncbi:MAG: polymorphic toxin type 4 domain-containing protein [Candidatus Sericytochromatia bacterium]